MKSKLNIIKDYLRLDRDFYNDDEILTQFIKAAEQSVITSSGKEGGDLFNTAVCLLVKILYEPEKDNGKNLKTLENIIKGLAFSG